MKISLVPNDSLLCDTDTVVSQAVAQDLFKEGIKGILRYVPLPGEGSSGDISSAELNTILGTGLGFMAVQHVRFSGWTPSKERGAGDGATVVNYLKKLQIPEGLSCWVDMESVGPGDSIGHVNAWAQEVKSSGYLPGVYVGPGWSITPSQLYYDLIVKAYWQSASRSSPHPTVRGSQMQQELPTQLAGIWIDKDVVHTDELGGLPSWLTQ